jgi:hypothetical protein
MAEQVLSSEQLFSSLAEKFKGLVAGLLPDAQVEVLIEKVMSLDSADDLYGVIELLPNWTS